MCRNSLITYANGAALSTPTYKGSNPTFNLLRQNDGNQSSGHLAPCNARAAIHGPQTVTACTKYPLWLVQVSSIFVGL